MSTEYRVPSTEYPLDEFSRAEAAAEFIRSKTALRPEIALVLGSGLGDFADNLTDALRIPYGEIPHFPRSTAIGHAGRLVMGRIAGTPVAVMQGRVHLYEGHSIKDVAFPMRVFGRLGIRAVILTNAAGGISSDLHPGCLVLVRDHINLQGASPLIGPNDDRFGLRFFDMGNAYDMEFRNIAQAEAAQLRIWLGNGVYAALLGPSFETHAEIQYLKKIGADLVGMSTVPEVIVARHMGIRVLAISCVTNLAAGLSDQPITHEEVLEIGARVQKEFVALLTAVIPHLKAALATHN
ncbi:MAG: purine-nucleoside phosphorylase [Terriglobales bacterium]